MIDKDQATDHARQDTDGHLDVGHRTGMGVLWLLLQSAFGRVVGIFSQVVLAWSLSPADFGAFALALTVTTLPSLLVSAGTLEFLIQRHKAIRLWSTTVFWMSTCFGAFAAILMCVLAPIASAIYATNLNGLIVIIALAAPISSISTISIALLRSSLRFRELAIIGTLELLFTPLFTVSLALLGFGPYSFAVPITVVTAFRASALWYLAPPHIARSANLRRWPLVTGRAWAIIGTRLIHAATSQADYSILGAVSSASAVGLYSFATKLATQPISLLAGNVHAVVFSALSQFANDPRRQYEAALAASRILAVIVFPTCFLLAAAADPIVRLLFGSKWISAVPLVQILTVGLAFDSVTWISGALIQARGEFRRDLLYTSLFSAPFFPLVFVGAHYAEAIGVACAVSGYFALCFPFYSWLIFRRGHVAARYLGAVYVRPAMMTTVAVGTTLFLSHVLENQIGDGIGKIIFVGCVGILGYGAILRKFDCATFDELWSRARRAGVGVLVKRLR
jgi:O-antigen/teichoic acid export membrane protein